MQRRQNLHQVIKKKEIQKKFKSKKEIIQKRKKKKIVADLSIIIINQCYNFMII